MNRQEMVEMHEDFATWMRVTGDIGTWRDAIGNQEAKPVSHRQWVDTEKFALMAAMVEPKLPRPTPGADDSGTVWITWETSSGRFSLTLVQNLISHSFQWVSVKDGFESTHKSWHMLDVFEAMRATLRLSK